MTEWDRRHGTRSRRQSVLEEGSARGFHNRGAFVDRDRSGYVHGSPDTHTASKPDPDNAARTQLCQNCSGKIIPRWDCVHGISSSPRIRSARGNFRPTRASACFPPQTLPPRRAMNWREYITQDVLVSPDRANGTTGGMSPSSWWACRAHGSRLGPEFPGTQGVEIPVCLPESCPDHTLVVTPEGS
jgi:hypothetical protein